MRTEFLELWDRTKYDIGSYESEWREMLIAAHADYDTCDGSHYADHADYDGAHYTALIVAAAAVVAAAVVAAAAAYGADYLFKRAEEKMEALR